MKLIDLPKNSICIVVFLHEVFPYILGNDNSVGIDFFLFFFVTEYLYTQNTYRCQKLLPVVKNDRFSFLVEFLVPKNFGFDSNFILMKNY